MFQLTLLPCTYIAPREVGREEQQGAFDIVQIYVFLFMVLQSQLIFNFQLLMSETQVLSLSLTPSFSLSLSHNLSHSHTVTDFHMLTHIYSHFISLFRTLSDTNAQNTHRFQTQRSAGLEL